MYERIDLPADSSIVGLRIRNDITDPPALPSAPASPGPDRLPLLPGGGPILLDLPPMRFRHVPGVYG